MDAVMRQGRITELNSATCVAPLNSFDGDDRNILVQGDVVGLRRVKGERAMVVLGDVLGEEDSLCRIEVAGDVIVAGRIEWAQVIAENILVGDSVTQSQLTAAGRIRIEAGIDNTSIEAGNFDGVRKRIESLVARIDRGKEVVESLVRRVGQDEKRMAKACRTLRVPLDFSVGRIVTHAQGKISVDLTSFYASLDEHKEAQLELALGEFFAKGVVGVVARTNRKYLVDYPAREKIFMQLLRSLKELFHLVVERDRTVRTLKAAEGELEMVLATLEERQPQVEVGGRVAAHVEMEFILPVAVRLLDTGVDFGQPETAALSVRKGASFGDLEISLRDTAGVRGPGTLRLWRGVSSTSMKTGAFAGKRRSPRPRWRRRREVGTTAREFFWRARSRRHLDILRIITGNHKGRAIPFSPKRQGDIRITSSRLKEAIFASMGRGGDLEGQTFLDLCAGSGQIGLEAHSRGARVTSVEPDFRRFTCLKKLLADWNVGDGMDVINTKAQLVIPQLEQQGRRFDTVYIDPPYEATLGTEPLCLSLLGKLGHSDILREERLVMVQHSRRLELPAKVGGLTCRKRRIYGDTLLSVYRPLHY